jgi:hypothetical protein
VTVLLGAERLWNCPNCTLRARTTSPNAPMPFHACRGLAGLNAPLVPAGTRCKVEAVQREDYVGGDLVTTDGDGRPVMAVETTRDDGNDVAVFAPCATAGGTAREVSR